MIEETIKNDEETLKPWLFQKGNAGGPGRPKGSLSVKTLVKEYLEEHPKDLKDFVEHFIKTNRELAWQMIEGRPFQDILSGGEKLPTPILNVFTNNGDNQDKADVKEDKGGAGGDISK